MLQVERQRRTRLRIRTTRQSMESLLVPAENRQPSRRSRSSAVPAFQQPKHSFSPFGAVAGVGFGAETGNRRSLLAGWGSENRRASPLREIGETAFSTVLLLRSVLNRVLLGFPCDFVRWVYPKQPVYRLFRRYSLRGFLVRSLPRMEYASILTVSTACSRA
jgi:hypothetical protein